MAGETPCNYGWYLNKELLQPIWFEGQELPKSLFNKGNENNEPTESDGEDAELTDTDSEAWSDDTNSDSNGEELGST